MNKALQLLGEIVEKARVAKALVINPETRQLVTEIGLAAKCAIEAERKVSEPEFAAAPKVHHRQTGID